MSDQEIILRYANIPLIVHKFIKCKLNGSNKTDLHQKVARLWVSLSALFKWQLNCFVNCFVPLPFTI